MYFSRTFLSCCFLACCTAGSAQAAQAPEQAPVEAAPVIPQKQAQSTEPPKASAAQTEVPNPEQSLAFKSIEQVNELSQIGLSGLAMRMIEQQQKLYPEFTPDWYAFEFAYVQTLSSLEQWQAIIDRSDQLLARAVPGQQITPKITAWFRTQRAIALLKLGEAEQALNETRSLLWEGRDEDRDRIALWRRLIIRAYLQLDYAEDANKGLLKYRQDYGDYKTEWKLLQAEALLRERSSARSSNAR